MRLIKSVCATDILGDVADSTENEMERNKIQSLLEALLFLDKQQGSDIIRLRREI